MALNLFFTKVIQVDLDAYSNNAIRYKKVAAFLEKIRKKSFYSFFFSFLMLKRPFSQLNKRVRAIIYA